MAMIQFEQGLPEIVGKLLFKTRRESTEDNRIYVLNMLVSKLNELGIIVSKSEEMKTRLCLDEVLANALSHGNRYNCEKFFEVTLFIDSEHWFVLVKDEGEGFKPEDLPDYQDENFIATSEGGRGLMLVNEIIDEITFFGKGNIVLLKNKIKNLQTR